MTRYAISLGSNLGDRIGCLRSALIELSRLGVVSAVSGLYETAPVGGPEQGPYLNAVTTVDTALGAHELLDELSRIEASHGRTREVDWGPRTLDLDIIAGEDVTIDDVPRLVVPHPRAHERRFVLEPLVEIWPDAPLASGATAEAELATVTDQDATLLSSDWAEPGSAKGVLWVVGQLVLFIGIGFAVVAGGTVPESLIDPVPLVGAMIGAVGGVSMLWSARALGDGLTALPEPRPSADFTESGPYRFVRHPMYTGVFLLFLGVAMFARSTSAIVLSVTLLGYFWLKTRYEERQLRVSYAGYGAYIERVQSRFMPHMF